MNKPIGTVRSCRVANSQQWGGFIREQVREFIGSLEDAGVTHWDISVYMGCHRSTVSGWKNGKGDITAKAFYMLKAFADERGVKRRVG